MKRREFIALVGGAASWTVAAHGQQPAMPVVGLLTPGSPAQVDSIVAVLQGLREAGFVERQNVAIEFRFAEGRFDRLPELAADLVRRQVNVIIALGGVASVAAKAATTTIPVVFYMGEDPVSLGLVPSLNRPSGNLTGVATLSSAVMAKRLELLRELVPKATVFAVLINPGNPSAEASMRDAQEAARALRQPIHVLTP